MKYTWKDVIFSPDDPRAKEAIGKEVYVGDCVMAVLNAANMNKHSSRMKLVDTANRIFPFTDDYEVWHAFIIVKKEPVIKRVPFDFNLKEDKDALRGRWITNNNNFEAICDHFARNVSKEWTTNWRTGKQLFNEFTFLDGEDAGQPVGKIVEEEDEIHRIV